MLGEKVVNNILGTKPKIDVKSRNKTNVSVKGKNGKYFIFDNNTDEFWLGYTFDNKEDAEKFAEQVNK